MQKNRHYLCDPHNLNRLRYPANHNKRDGLERPEPKCHPRGMEKMTKYFWMFTMKRQGTLEPKRGRKLEDTWATTFFKGWFDAMAGRYDNVIIPTKQCQKHLPYDDEQIYCIYCIVT